MLGEKSLEGGPFVGGVVYGLTSSSLFCPVIYSDGERV